MPKGGDFSKQYISERIILVLSLFPYLHHFLGLNFAPLPFWSCIPATQLCLQAASQNCDESDVTVFDLIS